MAGGMGGRRAGHDSSGARFGAAAGGPRCHRSGQPRFHPAGFEQARERSGAAAVILKLDTPGGLDSSMRDIIQAILASPVPIIGYVAPEGARAASAGTYMLYACHIAAMAPATNLGAATPVQLGGLPLPAQPTDRDRAHEPDTDKAADKPADQSTDKPTSRFRHGRKLVNDARAYIRSLAQLRGRNVEWAEQAVTGRPASVPKMPSKGVIDLIAVHVSDLLQQADGRSVEIAGAKRALSTRNLTVETLTPDWRNQLLAVVAHPMVAYVLLLIGGLWHFLRAGQSRHGAARRAGWHLPAAGAVRVSGAAGQLRWSGAAVAWPGLHDRRGVRTQFRRAGVGPGSLPSSPVRCCCGMKPVPVTKFPSV